MCRASLHVVCNNRKCPGPTKPGEQLPMSNTPGWSAELYHHAWMVCYECASQGCHYCHFGYKVINNFDDVSEEEYDSDDDPGKTVPRFCPWHSPVQVWSQTTKVLRQQSFFHFAECNLLHNWKRCQGCATPSCPTAQLCTGCAMPTCIRTYYLVVCVQGGVTTRRLEQLCGRCVRCCEDDFALIQMNAPAGQNWNVKVASEGQLCRLGIEDGPRPRPPSPPPPPPPPPPP